MRHLTLKALQCHQTEDWTGADECRLEVFVDGATAPAVMTNSVNNGQVWNLNRTFAFRNRVEVKLWDEDSPDADDFLGGVAIDTNPRANATATFTLDEANYTLQYSVCDDHWEIVAANSQVLAIHAALMPTNEILYFGGDEHSKAQHDRNEIDNTRLFNATTGAITALPSPTTDVFCSGSAFLPDGRPLVAGGTETWSGEPNDPHGHQQAGHFTGHRACWLYDFRNRAWTRVVDMRPQPGFEASNEGGGRWYPTLLTLADGKVLAVSGHPSRTDRRHTNSSPERYSPELNSWAVLTAEVFDSSWYPRLHVLPNGNVFSSSPVNGANRIYNPNTGRFVGPAIPLPGEDLYNGWGASSVLLPLLPGDGYKPRVLVCGASQPRRINLSEASPSWQPAGTRTGAAAGRVRENLSAVILPTGEVFLSGGVSVVNPENPVLEGEIYTPGIDWGAGTYTGTQLWTSVEPACVPRNYHSVALLMPNGRVWTAGSSKNAAQGDPATVGEMRIEVYKPAYDADPGRPQITACPTSIGYGQTFEVRTPQATNIRRVALIRAGSVTHAFDSDQRYVGLQFSHIEGDRLRVTAPPNGGIAPPGYYMLWILDGAGRPCTLARFVAVARRDWSDVKPVPGWFGWENQDGDVAVADINGNGRPDLVVFHVDNPQGDNHGYYRVGRDLDAGGNVTGGWSAPVQVPGWFGWENQGGGIAVADVSGNGRPDLVVFHIDNPQGDNYGYYRVNFDPV